MKILENISIQPIYEVLSCWYNTIHVLLPHEFVSILWENYYYD